MGVKKLKSRNNKSIIVVPKPINIPSVKSNKKSHSIEPKDWFTLILTICISITLFLIGLIPYIMILKYTEIAYGKITKINTGVTNNILTVEYEVEGKSYSKQFSISNRNVTARSVGGKIELYYEKGNPQNSSLNSKEDMLTFLIIMSIASFIGISVSIFVYVKWFN